MRDRGREGGRKEGKEEGDTKSGGGMMEISKWLRHIMVSFLGMINV